MSKYAFIADLHSILVKSILNANEYAEQAKKHLHSILVKSIRVQDWSLFDATLIYIPFWLNLYAAEGEIIVKDDLFTFHSG